ncbi:MAG: right-handed parallel beta-helix repeat-containing protein [Clostridiaceae bacterium]|nr:right-handed parallel beta-helix repeat-containing protein [Clostridiaceae bacterium]
MDVLGYLKSRQNELERINHPFSGRSPAFRYLYAYGVGVLALGSMKAMTELTDRFDYFLECISLPNEQKEQIVDDLNNHFEYRLTESVRILKTKEVQYCFFADLWKLCNLAVWSLEYCEKVIENYIQVFHMSETEIAFLRSFNDAAVKRDVSAARQCYHDFREAGFDIPYRIMQYFMPEFYDEESYGEIVVKAGKTLRIDKPARVSGDIVVERGGSLIFDGADLTMQGGILIDGGRIQFLDSKVFVSECSHKYFLDIRDAAVVRIENTAVDCNMQCGFLTQNKGRLLIEEAELLRSQGARMIAFSGRYIRIRRSSFVQGGAGFLALSGFCQTILEKCDFIQAEADYGGAFFSDSIDNTVIRECSFRFCNAKYLGGAIYFKYQKLGQVVRDCVYGNCEPAESAVFNVYQDDFELKIR